MFVQLTEASVRFPFSLFLPVVRANTRLSTRLLGQVTSLLEIKDVALYLEKKKIVHCVV